jgi:hypothetical protein
MPLVQIPLEHTAPSGHAPPFCTLQLPAPSQARIPLQPGPGSPAGIGAHAAPSLSHRWHMLHEAAQHIVPPSASAGSQ